MEGSLAKSANKWIKAKGLKSSSIPISFIPFNKNKDNCDCGNKYSKTLLFNQKYCKKCISGYIKLILNNNDNITPSIDQLHNFYLFKWVIIDVIIYTDNSIVCNNHEDKDFDKYEIQEFRGWCENCSKILYFKQVISDYLPSPSHIDNNCKLCGKVIDQHFLLCSDCYQISCRWVKSTLAENTENSVLIIYLPWWDTHDQCIICSSQLNFTSDYQKWCLYCCMFYIGCRYCLTTNIIFGITNQSQCKKCERASFIKINVTDIKESFLTRNHINQISNYISNIDKNSNQLEVYNFIKGLNCFPLKPSTDLISHSQITNLENNDGNSAMPIMFIPFINEEETCYYCYYCKRKYSQTLLFEQKYCKYCLFIYIKYSENNYNIDVCVSTKNTQCDKHEPRTLGFCAENIQEWCSYCSEISFFRQIVTKYKFDIMNYDQKIIINDHSQFFFESLESSLIKKPIAILYLPWWDAYYQCLACNSQLELKSNCQKWCSNCFIIYTGCRYCLTTNIIFGITNQSQCKKCKRLLFTNISISGNDTIDKFLCITKLIIDYDFQIDDYIKNTNPLEIYSYIKDKLNSSPSKLKIDWIPYSQIKNLEKIAEGGFGIIYKANIDEKVVAVKGFLNSQDPSNDFLNELKSLYQCYDEKFECIIRCHGITKNPLTNEFMFIMKFANGGNLYNYLHDNFTNITWKEKLYILWRISDGLQTIHEKDFIHRDFHSGNILIEIIENGSLWV
ncbi:unnamed protein product [Rhizophagus irregularis]|nr:unnamed protein product [Rhizophagus irregularis]